MILQALTAYYEDLLKAGKIEREGWSRTKVSYALYLNEDGDVMQAVPLYEERQQGRKTVLAPVEKMLPAPVKRSSGISPNFLWDNSAYILGVDGKGKPERAKECFFACRKIHEEYLDGLDNRNAKVLLAFFRNWDPDKAAMHPALREVWDDLMKGGNIIFRFDGMFLQDDPEIQSVWDSHYHSAGDTPEGLCLVTGKETNIAAIHPSLKGVRGAQSSGAALVSFNAPAFCSYEKEQNYNAPVSRYAAFAYTEALNHLIADRRHVKYLGDTTVVCWAAGGEEGYQSLFDVCFFGDTEQKYSEKDIRDKVSRLLEGKPVNYDEELLDPEKSFYILGIAPNAARLSVRFFLKDSFGRFIRNVEEHHKRMEIVRPKNDTNETIPLWMMLRETVNLKATDKSASPNMAGAVLRAILLGQRYPATLLNQTELRIRAEHAMTRGRAAIIKAYFLKNEHKEVPKEVLQVALNKESTNVPYNLGRLFSILENIQQAANPGINTTIRDKYFSSASAMPGTVFPILINLAQKHLKKIGGGLQVVLEKEMQEVLDKVGEEFPARQSLAQQGAFQLGYYHQTQARYQGKNKEEA